MPSNGPTLILVHEPEKACFDRLVADGYPTERAIEVSSYLAQSTDRAPEFGQLAAACETRGLTFMAVELDDAATVLANADPAKTLVWTLTDGIAYFRGGASPALARLNGLKTIGADDSLFALCQDKFRSGAVLGALGLPVP
ncbi:MAG: D-alanine:D-lactate ligase-like protein, partial [Mesorhizobium sp.]